MAGEIKKLQFSDGVVVVAPTGLTIDFASITSYIDDATFVSANGAAVKGSIYFNTTSNVLRYYTGTSWLSQVDESSSQVLTNKTIDADLNAVSNIDDNDIKAAAGIDATKIGGGGVTSSEFDFLSGVTSDVQTQVDAKIPLTQKSAANGVASLDASGKVPTAELPDSVLGALQFQGTWDATTNTPTLSSGSGTEGYYYIVSVAGTVLLNGISDWEIGDWVVAADLGVWNKIDNSDKVSSVAGKTGPVTLDLTDVDNGGSLVSPNISESVLLDEQASTPATPATGKKKIYSKTDNKLYTLDDAGLEQEVGTGAGGAGTGEPNYITNPSATDDTTGWTEENASAMTIVRTVTAAELPRENLTGTGFKIVTSSSGAGISVDTPITLDDVDLNKKLKVKFALKPIAGYVAGDYQVVILAGATELLREDIPNVTGEFLSSFDSDSTAGITYKVEGKVGLTSSAGVVISDVIIGPGSIVTGANISDLNIALSLTNFASTNDEVLATRVGKYLELVWYGTTTTSPTSTMGWTLPAGLTVDTSKVALGASGTYLGLASARVSGLYYQGSVIANTSTRLQVLPENGAGNWWGNAGFPGTWTTSDTVTIQARIPIAEWAGSGTVNLGANDVEYAFNTSTSTTSDTTSFGSGTSGANIAAFAPSGNASIVKRVQFPSAQATDTFELQINTGGNTWLDFKDRLNSYFQNDAGSISYGAKLIRVSDTQLDVGFYSKPDVSNAWSAVTAWKWRVVKHRSGIPVGFGLATATASGLIPNYESTTISLNGNFTLGTLKITKIGNVVTASVYGIAWSSTLADVASLTGLIPSNMVPNTDIHYFTVFDGAGPGGYMAKVRFKADGQFRLTLFKATDLSDPAPARASTEFDGTQYVSSWVI